MAAERRRDPGSYRHLQPGPERHIVGRRPTDQLPDAERPRTASHVNDLPAGEQSAVWVPGRVGCESSAERLTWASTLGTRALSPRLSAHGPVVRLAGAP